MLKTVSAVGLAAALALSPLAAFAQTDQTPAAAAPAATAPADAAPAAAPAKAHHHKAHHHKHHAKTGGAMESAPAAPAAPAEAPKS